MEETSARSDSTADDTYTQQFLSDNELQQRLKERKLDRKLAKKKALKETINPHEYELLELVLQEMSQDETERTKGDTNKAKKVHEEVTAELHEDEGDWLPGFDHVQKHLFLKEIDGKQQICLKSRTKSQGISYKPILRTDMVHKVFMEAYKKKREKMPKKISSTEVFERTKQEIGWEHSVRNLNFNELWRQADAAGTGADGSDGGADENAAAAAHESGKNALWPTNPNQTHFRQLVPLLGYL